MLQSCACQTIPAQLQPLGYYYSSTTTIGINLNLIAAIGVLLQYYYNHWD